MRKEGFGKSRAELEDRILLKGSLNCIKLTIAIVCE